MTPHGEVYDSGDIVERFLHDKLQAKGIAWESHPAKHHSDQILPSSALSTTSTSLTSPGAGSVKTRRMVSAPPSGEESLSHEDPPVAPHPEPHGPQAWVLSRRQRLQAVLQHQAAALQDAYQQDLCQLSAHFLHVSPGAVRSNLRAISGELFGSGVNWGRVVTMLEFGATICVEGAGRDTSWTADDVAAWLVESLDSPALASWIGDNGGWDAFVEQYDPARPPGGCWSVRKMVGLVVLGAAGITLGALFTQK